jgi:DNA-binding winged helix-turn-helix (wHTH) protein
MPIALPMTVPTGTDADPLGGASVAATPRSFTFGEFVLVPARQSLMRGDRPVRIGGRALDLLTALVERPGELVDKQTLMARAWPTTFVDATNLKVNMASLRKALGERHLAPEYIATVVGRGYRFIAPVRPAVAHIRLAPDPAPHAEAQVAGLLHALDGILRELRQLGLDAPCRSQSSGSSAR